MKKLQACLIIVLMMASIGSIWVQKRASATASASITFNPSQQNSWMYWGSGSGNGTVYEFSVNIVITGVTDMAAWQLGIFWNNQYLNCDSATINSPQPWVNNSLSLSPSNGTNNSYNSTNGYFCYACAAELNIPDFTGNITIATLTFHQLTNLSATTPLNFDISPCGLELMDGNMNDIAFSSTDGSIVMHTGTASTNVSITGNGSNIQLCPYPLNEANWNCSLTNDNDTSYVSSSGEGDIGWYDLYTANFSGLPQNMSNIAVTVHIVVRSTSNNPHAIFYTVLYANSTGVQMKGTSTVGTSYTDESNSFNVTQNDVATLQIGVGINDGVYRPRGGIYQYYPGYCTQVYAVIAWT